MMIFGTTDFTYHGHRNPLDCPEDITRKSLALYYTNGRPAEEVAREPSTILARVDSRICGRHCTACSVACNLVPPLIVHLLS
jgi:hypothetical protein